MEKQKATQPVTIQFKVQAIVEKKISATSLEDAIVLAKSISWSDIFPGVEIADGTFKVVGLFTDWDA